MFSAINEATDSLIHHIEKVATKKPLDSRNVGIKFGVGTVSSCLFGLRINALENQESEYLRMTLKFFEVSFSRGIQAISCFFLPQLIDFFHMSFLDKSSVNFMEKTFLELFQTRQTSQLKYNDLVDILTEILNSPNSQLQKEDVIAMAISLLSAGYETTGTSLSFLWYELSRNQNIQQRLRNEIQNELKGDKDISYDVVTKIKYLDMVINESLRKYPLLGFIDRLCVKTYKVPNYDLVIEKGTGIYISAMALHYDEKYFPNPNEFDPERFSNENKALIPDCVYMPFGIGLRACIEKYPKFEYKYDYFIYDSYNMRNYLLNFNKKFCLLEKEKCAFLSPSLLFGNVLPILTGKFQASVFFNKLHSSTNLPYLGLFVFNRPFVLIRDLDIIKHILLKDFDYFMNKTVKTSKHDRIGSKMLILRKDQSWRISRRNVSPIFTPKKLRSMFCGINQVTDNLINYIEKVATKNPLDSRNVGIKFGVNVVSSCLFGLKINALENQESEFLRMTLRLLEISLSRGIQVISCFFVPQIIDFFDMTFLDKSGINFMEKIFIQLLNARQTSQLKYDDLIDILTEILNSPNSELTKDDLVAMAISFLSAGYETTGTSLSFLWYELSLNQNIQQRLRNEIRNELKNNKDISYDVITKIKYLDMVVNESLRKYPLIGFIDRLCVKTYKVPNHDLVIEKGTGVYISPLALHYDEKYFPNPDEFDPERFSTENKPLIPHCAYMPFGKGSRACIGARFALLVLKVAIAKTILNFKVELSKSYTHPIVFDKKSFLLIPKNGKLDIIFKKIA
ncbi:hypothetical protein RN001_012881 [Aquatica leii]|uniref:Cytochrome P450 n=1 Tax=Aquatica leii TaxID=1421715 RepID=A0AAN7P3W2_9COLE|nr:hypothetical protein RN001_012881 [Aquatica leii]